jgi:hypothetical protein
MQVWTTEKLASAANLYKLGLAPKTIAKDIGVPLRDLMAVIERRADLFTLLRRKKRVRQESDEARERRLAHQREREYATRRRTVAPVVRDTDYLPGIDADLREAPMPPGQGPVSLLQLTSRHCKWVLPRVDRSAPILFCGDASRQGQSWCACHAEHVWETRG